MDIEYLLYQDDWKPTTDLEISQLMKFINEKRKETEKVVVSAKEEIELLQEVGKKAEEKLKLIESKVNKLCEYYVLNELDEDEVRHTPTTIKYKLARGEIVINKPKHTIVKPTDIEPLIKAYPEYTKKQLGFKWGDFKKNLKIDKHNNVVNKKTGELIENVEVIEEPSSVKIKVNI